MRYLIILLFLSSVVFGSKITKGSYDFSCPDTYTFSAPLRVCQFQFLKSKKIVLVQASTGAVCKIPMNSGCSYTRARFNSIYCVENWKHEIKLTDETEFCYREHSREYF